MLPNLVFPLESPILPNPLTIMQPIESPAIAGTGSLNPNDLRAYQHALADIVVSPGSFIVSIPTGMGKTVIAWHVLYRLYRAYALATASSSFLALVVAPTVELCNQHVKTIREYADAWGAHEVIVRNLNSGGAFYPFFRKTIAVTTPGKLMALLGDGKSDFGLEQVQIMVFDEAHNAAKSHVMVELAAAVRDYNRRVRIAANDDEDPCDHPIKVIGLTATVARIKNTPARAAQQLIARTKELERLFDGAQLVALNDLFPEHVQDDFQAHKNEVAVSQVDYVPALCDEDLKSMFSTCWSLFLASASDLARVDPTNGAELEKRHVDALKSSMAAPMTVVLPIIARTPVGTVESFVRSIRNKFADMYKARMAAAIFDDECGLAPEAPLRELVLQRAASFGTLAILTLKYGPKAAIPFIFNPDSTLHLPESTDLAPIADRMLSLADVHKETDLMQCVYRLVQSELQLATGAAVSHKRVLIFNTTQEDTLWTAYLINTYFGRPVAAALVGVNVTQSELKRDMPTHVIDSAVCNKPVAALRAGDRLVLVSTTVAEEGIDVPACSLVVRMDTVGSGVQVGQSKGRARQRDGRMVVLCPNRNADERGDGWKANKGYEAQRLQDSQRMLQEMHSVTQDIGRENVKWILTMKDVCGEDGTGGAADQVSIPNAAMACRYPQPSATPRNELETLLRLIGFSGKDFAGVFEEECLEHATRFQGVVTMLVPIGLQAQLGGSATIVGQSQWCTSKKDGKRGAYSHVLAQVLCPDHKKHLSASATAEP